MVSYSGPIVFVLLALQASASRLELTARPSTVTPSLTKNLTLRCGIQATTGAAQKDNGERQRKKTRYDVTEVLSIIVTRGDGDYVAAITQNGNVQTLTDDDNLLTEGNVTGTHGDQAYIELTWSYPDFQETNTTYKCEVNAMDKVGHVVRFSKGVEIQLRRPTVEKLSETLNKVLKQNDDSAQQIRQLQANVAQLQEAMSGVMAKALRTERGNGTGCARTNVGEVFTVSFKKPYSDVPDVGITQIGGDQRYDVATTFRVKDVNNTGFSVVCSTSSSTAVEFQWISIGI